MNKKLIKTIGTITCGLGIISSIPFWSSSCGCSNEKVSLYNIPSLNALLNFNPSRYTNFSLNPETDYTDGNREIPSGDPDYPKYIKKVTTDMFKEENLEKTKDFLAFSIVLGNLNVLKEKTIGGSSDATVEEYNQKIKEMVKSFSLKVSPISNLQILGEAEGYDIFSFSCTSEMEFVIEKDGQQQKVNMSIEIKKLLCHFDEIAFLIRKNSGELQSNGYYVVSLISNSDEFTTTTLRINDEEAVYPDAHPYWYGILPSLSWLNIAKDLKLCENCH